MHYAHLWMGLNGTQTIMEGPSECPLSFSGARVPRGLSFSPAGGSTPARVVCRSLGG
jgi:hypothetical protein